ncbi:hypothetical protein DKG34_37810 [Streptomyces sp. NWU49]|nr:hypothetical protein DKG34_37810 [Streptomyces sp. NWU49]
MQARRAALTWPRRKLLAWTVTALLLAGTAGCLEQDSAPAADAAPHRPTPSARQAPPTMLKGPRHLILTLASVVRDTGGFVTVRGTLTNQATKTTVVPAHLAGTEPDIVKHGPSLGGATLVDFVGGRRYYVLRDTDGRPLTTTGVSLLKARESVPVYLQFPAPPASTRRVSFQLPQFDTATLTISG